MDSKLPGTFWTRREFDSATPDVLLAAVWLYTQPRLNLCGFGEINLRLFQFETRLPPEALAKAIEALGKGIVCKGEDYLLADHVALNFGRGSSLGRSHMALALLRAAEGTGRAWVALGLREIYPELAARWDDEYPELSQKPSPRAPQGPENRIAENSIVEIGMGVQGERGGTGAPPAREPRAKFTPPTFAEVADYSLTLASFVPAGACSAFYDHFEANGWRIGGQTPMRSWPAAFRTWLRRAPAFDKKSLGPAAGAPSIPFNPNQPHAHTEGSAEIQ